jgi:hypothetical protein
VAILSRLEADGNLERLETSGSSAGLVARAQRGPVALGEPGGEASAGRCEPNGELRIEDGDFLAKLEEAEVEQPLGIALVEVELDALD